MSNLFLISTPTHSIALQLHWFARFRSSKLFSSMDAQCTAIRQMWNLQSALPWQCYTKKVWNTVLKFEIEDRKMLKLESFWVSNEYSNSSPHSLTIQFPFCRNAWLLTRTFFPRPFLACCRFAFNGLLSIGLGVLLNMKVKFWIFEYLYRYQRWVVVWTLYFSVFLIVI